MSDNFDSKLENYEDLKDFIESNTEWSIDQKEGYNTCTLYYQTERDGSQQFDIHIDKADFEAGNFDKLFEQEIQNTLDYMDDNIEYSSDPDDWGPRPQSDYDEVRNKLEAGQSQLENSIHHYQNTLKKDYISMPDLKRQHGKLNNGAKMVKVNGKPYFKMSDTILPNKGREDVSKNFNISPGKDGPELEK